MSQSPKLQVKIDQRLRVSGQLRQSVEMLNLSRDQLAEHIATAVENNPFLRLKRPSGGLVVDVPETLQARGRSTFEQLRSQIATMRAPEDTKRIATYLLSTLTPQGYFDSSVPEEAHALGIDEEAVEQALALVQRCAPPGVGARGLAECLALQLVDQGYSRSIATQAIQNLPRLLMGEQVQVATELGLSEPDVDRLLELSRTLTSTPIVASEDEAVLLRPDARVLRLDTGGFHISLIDDPEQLLRFDAELLERVRKDPSARTFADLQAQEGDSLLQAIRFRSHTLTRLVQAIIEAQPGFFAPERAPLLPLSRVELAEKLNLHPSTVSRAALSKAIEFEGLVYPLKSFFSVALRKGSTGEVSADAVQARLREIIAAETAETVKSDSELCKILHAEGVDISRRTVAKYRGCMNVPSSVTRRRLLTQRAKREHISNASLPKR